MQAAKAVTKSDVRNGLNGWIIDVMGESIGTVGATVAKLCC